MTTWFEIIKLSTLYKRDSKGKVRVWRVEIGRSEDNEQSGYRVISGLEDGKKVESEWKMTERKNEGRANETNPFQQAQSEVEALYTRQKEKGYFEDLKQIDTFDTFKPMLAEKYKDAEKKKKLPRRKFAQPKLDGLRCNIMLEETDDYIRVEAFSRNAKPYATVDHIKNLLWKFFDRNPDLVLDGELYNHELKDDFNQIASLARKTKPTPEELAEGYEKIQYHVYDLFDPSIPEAPFEQRSKMLKTIVDEINDPRVVFVETVEVETLEELDELYGRWLEEGYEGQMVRANTPYEQDRTWALLKRKEFIDEEFKVVAVEEGKGNWSGAVKKFVLETADGVQFKAGVRGKKEVLQQLLLVAPPDWATCRYFKPPVDSLPRFGVVTDWGYGERND